MAMPNRVITAAEVRGRRTFSGHRRRWAVCAPRFSESRLLRLLGNAWANAPTKIWKVSAQIRELQKEALTRGWGHGAIDVEPLTGMLDQPN
jgi:hypothetical protein